MNVTLIESGKLFDLRDSSARLVCEYLLSGKTQFIDEFLQQFKKFDDEIKRRVEESLK